ncbi:MAG: hypothetical protein AAFR09_02385 [Pseudomonadota bacterium]
MVTRSTVFAGLAAAALAVMCGPTCADTTPLAAANLAPVTGGLSLVPERWRYRPAPAALPADFVPFSAPEPVSTLDYRTELLETDYVADRGSFINTVRARRGLPFLTLWEGAGRCLFFGINDRGRAGFNFVKLRRAKRVTDVSADSRVGALYAELTGERRATFPEPPKLFPH